MNTLFFRTGLWRNTFIFTFVFFLQSSLYSQSLYSITGYVRSVNTEPVPSVKISIFSMGDSVFSGKSFTDSAGYFILSSIHPGVYYLEISAPGFENFRYNDLKIYGDSDRIELGIIQIRPVVQTYVTAVAKVKKPMVEHEVGKVIYNVDANVMYSNSTLYEVLERLPGISIDKEGNIYLKGRRGVSVFIDGKLTSNTGLDLISLLKGTPSSNIQKIEVMSNPSSGYDASGAAGAIHIYMKKTRQKGVNGNISSGFSQGVLSKTLNGFSLNGKKDRFMFNSSYSYSVLTGFTRLQMDRTYIQSDSLKEQYFSSVYISDLSRTHFSRLRAVYDFNRKVSVAFSTSFQANRHTSISSGSMDSRKTTDSGRLRSDFNGNAGFKRNNLQFGSEFKKNIDSNGCVLSLNYDYSLYSESVEQNNTIIFEQNKNSNRQMESMNNDQRISNSMSMAKIDFVKPFGKKYKFETGAKTSWGNFNNSIKTYGNSNFRYGSDSSDKGKFVYKENIVAEYFNLSGRISSFNVQAGMRFEHTISVGALDEISVFNRNYINLFPSFSAEYKLNKQNLISFFIGKRIERPNYQQMNSYKKMLNQNTYLEGNPLLLPQISRNCEIGYVYKNKIYITYGHSSNSNFIAEVLVQDTVSKFTYQTYANLNRSVSDFADISISGKLRSWWTTNSSLQLSNTAYSGSFRNLIIHKKLKTFNFNLNNTISLNKQISMELDFQYFYRNFYGNTLILPNSNFSLGFQKNVLKNKGSITIGLTDIFWTSNAKGVLDQNSIKENWTTKRDTRLIRIGFIYKFDKK